MRRRRYKRSGSPLQMCRRFPNRRSRSRSCSPRQSRRPHRRSASSSPRQNFLTVRQLRSLRSQLQKPKRIFRSRSCPLLHSSHNKLCTSHVGNLCSISPRYRSLSPGRFRTIKYFLRSRSRSKSPYVWSRSRSRSPYRRSRSRSRSPYRRSRNRSRSPYRRSHSRNRSFYRRSRSRSRSFYRSRSRSRSFFRRSRRSLSNSSGSLGDLSSCALSRSCSRSRSPQIMTGNTYRSRSRSRSPYRRGRSLSSPSYSPTSPRYSRSRSRSPPRRRTRRGRARRRGRRRTKIQNKNNACQGHNDTEAINATLDIDGNVSDFFFADISVDEHVNAQNKNRCRYIAGMTLLHQKGVELHQRVRARALAASWARKDFKLSTDFLRDRDRYGVAEILKALQILDSGRRIRQRGRMLKRLQLSTSKVSRHKIEKLKCKISNLRKIQPKQGSVNLSVCKNVRKWTKTLRKEELERYALHLPKEPWKKLADICHFNPVEDFPNLPWFLSYCFGKPSPSGTVVHICQDLNEKNINDKLKMCDIPYSHCRHFKKYLDVESKIKIATSEPRLDTVLWYYEDLECRQVDEVIMQRLDTGDTSDLPIGKLMDRLLTLKELARGFRHGRRTTAKYKIPFMKTLLSLAESKLRDVKLKLDAPVVVLGDRSASMDIAVRTSSVITGILCSICSADLVVFNGSSKRPKVVPTNVDEALKLAMKTVAHGSTNPSSALKPFYKRKRVVKTFIIVTDEEENTGNFADLFEKYHAEVYPARLVFVSFLEQHQKGDMCPELMKRGFKPLQFVLNRKQPDLTKLEKLFGILASGSNTFNEELSILQSETSGNIHASDL